MTAQTTPSDPHDPTGAASPFGGLGTGLDFFQQWMKAASSALPNMGSAATQGATAWAVPTLDPQELDKRIQELKTVQFWLEQNARMLGMTIQTLEVQRMTLTTLKGMKVPMEALRESLMAQTPLAAGSATGTGTGASSTPGSDTPAPEAMAAAVNPLQWWNTLTEQFTALASQAVQAGQDAQATAEPADASASSGRSVAAGEESPESPSAKGRPGTPQASGSTVGKTPKR